jgi:hypothetical protein
MYLDALRRAFVEAVVDPTIGPAASTDSEWLAFLGIGRNAGRLSSRKIGAARWQIVEPVGVTIWF